MLRSTASNTEHKKDKIIVRLAYKIRSFKILI